MGCEWLSVGEGCGDGWPGGRLLSSSGCGRALRLPWLLLLGWEPRGRAGAAAPGDGTGGPCVQQTELWELDFGKGDVQTTRWSSDVLPREQGAWYQAPPGGFICKPFPCSLSPLPVHPAPQQPRGPGYLPCPYLLPFQPSRLGSCKGTTLPAARPCCVPGAHGGAVQLPRGFLVFLFLTISKAKLRSLGCCHPGAALPSALAAGPGGFQPRALPVPRGRRSPRC